MCINSQLFKTILFVLIPIGSTAQWSIQSGYDFGAMKFKENSTNVAMNSKWDFVNRLHLITEYSCSNDLLVSINSGVDVHHILRDQERIVSNANGGTDVFGGRFDSNIQTFRIGFSIGYQWHLNKFSSLVLKINAHQFFVNRIRIFEMVSTWKQFDVPKDEINGNQPVFFSSELDNSLDYEKIGYKNKWKKNNNNMNISIEYRRTVFSLYHFAFFAGYSPFDRRIYPITSKKRNLFLFGVRFAHTFPQKTGKDEK